MLRLAASLGEVISGTDATPTGWASFLIICRSRGFEPHPSEDDFLRREVWAGSVACVQPDCCLRMLGVAAPPCWVLVGAWRQPLSDDLGHLGEGHLDPWVAGRPQVPFQTLVLLASDHDDIMAG